MSVTVELTPVPGGFIAAAYDWGAVEAIGSTQEEAEDKFIEAWHAREWPHFQYTGAQFARLDENGERSETGVWVARYEDWDVIEVRGSDSDTPEAVQERFLQEWNQRTWPREQFDFMVVEARTNNPVSVEGAKPK